MSQIVLIVEDSDHGATTLEIALSGAAGLNTVSVTEGNQAWRYLRDHPEGSIAAVVTDLNMPGMDGFELIRNIRGSARYDKLPIIVVSGCTDPGAPSRVAELGASAFFGKPFSPARVRATLERLLNEMQTTSSA